MEISLLSREFASMGNEKFLAIFPSPARGVWYLGNFPLRAYAICILVGIIVAIFWSEKRWLARGGEANAMTDIALWAVPFGVIGGRLYHLATDWSTYFGAHGLGCKAALKIQDGGLGIWGAVLLGGCGAAIACKRKNLSLSEVADVVAPPIILAQAIGRLGNYFNQELYGRSTSLPWGLEIFNRRNALGEVGSHVVDGSSTGQVVAVVHPTFLYEIIWNLLVCLLLVILERRFAINNGRLFALYVAGYCFGRFWIELLRSDPATTVMGIRINVFTSLLGFLLAAIYFGKRKNRKVN